jgi:hypothetical protein
MNCRHCLTPLEHRFLDLGFAPPSNAYLTKDDLSRPEIYYPLRAKVCEQCWLVQTEDYAPAISLFSPEYAYFSSTSRTWLTHAEMYARKITNILALNRNSFVVEIASNDGYLLKNFVAAGIPCIGIEPTKSTADISEMQGVPVLREFFGEALAQQLAAEGDKADLIIGNNVYAHVPDINDFTRGLRALLKPSGTITLEFPHLMHLIRGVQFDTVYHEHFSYLSLHTVSKIFEASGLRVWHVEELPTHGGSLRIFGCHAEDERSTQVSVRYVLQRETQSGLQLLNTYLNFQSLANNIKNTLLDFLIEQQRAGKKVAGYGAAAKGNTLLNYAGVRPDLLHFVCDAAPAKQGKFMPGSHIPIVPPSQLLLDTPDYMLILPWNIAAEVQQQNAYLKDHGVRFVTAVPELAIQ